jgi:oligoribonuclease NrnB/cAMP/cGMP phosphodiesterase (DHH superfamily)
MSTIVIYHAGCIDGFTAAWVTHAYLSNLGVVADYLPCNYSTTPDVSKYTDIFMVDFCLPVDTLDGWVAEGKNLRVIDHHKTAEEMLRGKPYGTFDMNECGASLCWKTFFPGRSMPKLIEYVRDRDIWLNALPYTNEVSAGLYLVPRTFESFDIHASRINDAESFQRVIAEGQVALSVKADFIATMKRKVRYVDFLGYSNVPVVNAPSFGVSELLHELAEASEHGFAVAWSQEADGFQYSFRSVNGFDVANLAKQLGGGGHKPASGARVQTLVHDILAKSGT